ncbi:nitrogenase iron-molybdenum cofactor biosynthesis protein NifN [Rhodomicrobium sp. Az07]|uniref:nitrogenase iron-molybdenum cofactor biosynthesis protein NifN n=1 Tax=Rhodomicrobium sp. Az07 TaxID=2839034 RepID=UPI001BE5A9C8|nr:nitrogenase iron-molybdenum cofactor biosynthesis protein NifN [Rhodomicrobium sp. Az07]MBT3070524.1 nitrogenase iron-molybdenum cofactor biosynthesis protein NifN [Rhodomicrobium sp. Az07]
MARVELSKKACSVNPLKMSQPIGGALAFLGLNKCMPLLHGSQGCTSFGLVLFVRHFREAIPMQTTAMSEVSTVLGGFENVEQAIVTIATRTKPEVIGICSTGVTEVKGDDVDGFLKLVRQNHPELDHVKLVYVSTPDFEGALEDGWRKAVTRMVEELVDAPPPGSAREANRVNILPGSHLTPGDLDELRDICEAFGLETTFLPDLSGSLDGHMPEEFSPTTIGGASVSDIAGMGRAAFTIAIGEQMRDAAVALEAKTGVPFRVFDRLTGLAPNDALMALLMKISGRPAPNKIRRQRSQLLDAMLDGHFSFGGKTVAVGAEPDLLFSITSFLTEMGATIGAAVTSTQSPILHKVPAEDVLVGDLEDFEHRAKGMDLLVTHSHGRQASERLHIPLFRYGLPTFDRLGAAHRVSVGYRGTRSLIFDIGNVFMSEIHEATPDIWADNLASRGEGSHDDTPTAAH